ncbi:hypothetical protein GCM10027161_65370 [Microbispora hainanensis]
MEPITRARRGARRGAAAVVAAEGRGDRALQGRRICVLLIIMSGRRQGLTRAAAGGRGAVRCGPEGRGAAGGDGAVAGKADTRALLRVIDAASCDQETHTTRASRTAVLTAHHHMRGENRLGETFWKTMRKCVKYRKKVSEWSSRRTGGGP